MASTVPAFTAHYWGKAMPAQNSPVSWHPNAYHCLDVAAAGAALLDARPQMLVALAKAVSLPEPTVRAWLLFALSIHDVGKFTDCFQCKVPERWHHKPTWQGMMPNADYGHGGHGLALWQCDDMRSHEMFGLGHRALDRHHCFTIWLQAVHGHHGKPIERQSLDNRICSTARTDAREFVFACAEHFGMAGLASDQLIREQSFRRTSWLVAGFAMLADWIGSNQDWFGYEPPIHSMAEYWPIALDKARDAIAHSGLAPPAISMHYDLSSALPSVASPMATPLQTWAMEQSQIGSQSLVVIEDLTGAGKTEAALIATHRLMAAGAAEGFYWALPTMATADALYRRLAQCYGSLFTAPEDASLVLAHGSREFNDIFKKSIRLEATQPQAETPRSNSKDEDVSATAACTRWLADDRRKTFLADVGVGTIDQAVLGVLPSKHQAMRLAGLSRRVLVIDEIHSLDAYQSVLTERLLMFHAAFGGSAILVSATLTTAARQKLADAFAKGAGWKKQKIAEGSFPLATVLDSTTTRSTPLASTRGTRRDLPVKRLDSSEDAIAILKRAHCDGLGAVWIRNTVQDALDAHEEIRRELPDAPIDLFHARFALGDRLEIEQRVLANFGKASEGAMRRRIVIATQVVEQSLDCDWDVMITDLAPIDLIIQRAGRLHRHDHRSDRPAPVLYVVGPEPLTDAGSKWYETAFPRGAFVYPHHGQLWLTMKALCDAGDAGALPLQSQNPRTLLERVYGAAAKFPEGLERPAGRAEGAAMSARAVGGMNALDLEKGYVHHAGAWESDTRTPTRLGDASRTLRLARWDGQRLTPWRSIEEGDIRKARRLSEVSVLATRVTDIATPEKALERAIAAEIATWPESYDPPLLVPLVHFEGETWMSNAIARDVRNARDVAIKLVYSPSTGLRFQAA